MRAHFLFTSALLIAGCGNLQNLASKATAKQREKKMQKLAEAAGTEASRRVGANAVGEVVRVDEASGFAIVRTRNGLMLPAGVELLCSGAGSARLKVTAERNNIFCFAADILSGTPQKGDSVTAVNSSTKPSPKLVPVNGPANILSGGSAPDNTLNLDPSSIRPADLPRSTLDEPGSGAPPPADASEPGRRLLEPPLPDSPR